MCPSSRRGVKGSGDVGEQAGKRPRSSRTNGNARRAVLYGAIAALAVTLTATDRLWQTSAGSVAWLVLMGASLYAGGAVLWSLRRY